MSIMGKQINLGQLLGILTSLLIPIVGYMYNLGVRQAVLEEKVASHAIEIVENKEARKETNKKLDTIIEITTRLSTEMKYKQDIVNGNTSTTSRAN